MRITSSCWMGGRVIGAGTHEQLLETCPDYREIYDVQMGEVG